MRLKPVLYAALIDSLLAAGDMSRQNGLLRLKQHAVQRSAADEKLWARVHPQLDDAEGKVPVVHDLAKALSITPPLLQAHLQRMAAEGAVIKVSAKRYFLPETIARFREIVLELAQTLPDNVFSAADFRDKVGIGRNAVIEILEYFDRTGLTRRHGQVRLILNAER